ncbi:sensor histidine kinase [Croceivirga radicis]|uniref:sensor histidine kinase n=1 Tax=Croceivirga radicis TaxID=1929488 RepID=UPI000255AF74|nr:sensor histidine kinase [Croceivirga radicis]
MTPKQTLVVLTFLATALLCLPMQAQSSQEVNPLETFSSLEGAQNKLDYFFNTPNRYTENSAYDWLESVRVSLSTSEKTNDTLGILAYKLMEAKLYSDIGDNDKSIAIAKELYNGTDSLELDKMSLLLELMDENYQRLQMYDKQIEIRELKKSLGLTENVAYHDIYASMGLYRQAMKQYIMDVKPTIPDNDYYAFAQFHNKIGYFLYQDKSAPTALTEFNKSISFLNLYINDISIQKTEIDIFNSEALRAEVEGNIGKSQVLLKQYIEAIPNLNNSIKTFKEFNHGKFTSQITENTLNLAEAHLQLDNNRTAKKLLEEEFEEMTVEQRIKRNRLLAQYYDKIENYKSAAQFYKKNAFIKDSLKANEVSILKQQLVAIVGTSDLENSRKLIAEQKMANEKIRNDLKAQGERIYLVLISLIFTVLGLIGLVYAYAKSIKNQRLIAEQKHFIEDSLKEKESLLREIHHRVKNNLQMVSSLLSLQTRNTKSKAAIAALEEGKSRVKAMALIHQKLYQNEDLSYIEMQGYIESLINSVQSVFKKGGHNISITVDAEGTELDIDRAIPFGLILNELVSNTFKYAFPDGDDNGKIYIHLRKDGDKGYFEYSDNGVGLPEDMDERTNTSMGFRLINRLVNQLQSKLNVDHTKEGVRFWFNF